MSISRRVHNLFFSDADESLCSRAYRLQFRYTFWKMWVSDVRKATARFRSDRMKPNAATIALVKRFEGLELDAYKDPVNVVTIGYGYTNRAGYGDGVKMGDTWTASQATKMLSEGLERFGNTILPMMKRKPTPDQYGAMLSLAYNIGTGAFGRSTCLKRFNAGDMEGAAEALTWFSKAGGKVLRGLVRRREAERDLFLSGNAAEAHSGPVDEPKTPLTSTTNWAAGGAAVSVVASASEDAKSIIANLGVDPNILLVIFGLAAVGWIFRERIKKMASGH